MRTAKDVLAMIGAWTLLLVLVVPLGLGIERAVTLRCPYPFLAVVAGYGLLALIYWRR